MSENNRNTTETSKNLLTPDVKVLMNYRRIKEIARCNNFIKNRTENVAEHSFYVTTLAMMIADDVDANNPSILVNTEKVLRYALLHDTEEAITSDVPYNVKHRTEEFHEAISKVLSEISEESYQGCSDRFKAYHNICNNSKEGVEGRIVDLADMLELALYCMEEVATGNMYMGGLFERALNISLERNKEFNSLFVIDLVTFMRYANTNQIASLNCL